MLAQVAQPESFGFTVIKSLLEPVYENEQPLLFVVWLDTKNNEAEFITRRFSPENPE